jgi:hypothetical protein
MPGKTPFLEGIQRGWGALPPWVKASIGAAGGAAAYRAAAIPVEKALSNKFEKNLDVHENESPKAIGQIKGGEDLARWVEKFKTDHPETKAVPVYASGKIPTSYYVPKHFFMWKGVKEHLKREFGITQPGVYVKEKDAALALHELGHASLDEKFPKIQLLTHAVSAAALPMLAWAIFKKPGVKPHFIERYAPEIAAAMQLPFLAEEATASIMARKSLKSEGGDSKRLGPAFASHAVGKGLTPAAAIAAMFLKRT